MRSLGASLGCFGQRTFEYVSLASSVQRSRSHQIFLKNYFVAKIAIFAFFPAHWMSWSSLCSDITPSVFVHSKTKQFVFSCSQTSLRGTLLVPLVPLLGPKRKSHRFLLTKFFMCPLCKKCDLWALPSDASVNVHVGRGLAPRHESR